MDNDTKRRVLAELHRFEAMSKRLPALPTVQDFDKQTDQRLRTIMELVVRSHSLIRQAMDELVESDDHHYDVRTEQEINSLWRGIVTLRDIVPIAILGENVANAHKTRDDYTDKQEFICLVKQLNSTLTSPPSTLKGWENHKEIKPYKNKYSGKNTLRDWINEALPGTLKSGRPKKGPVI